MPQSYEQITLGYILPEHPQIQSIDGFARELEEFFDSSIGNGVILFGLYRPPQDARVAQPMRWAAADLEQVLKFLALTGTVATLALKISPETQALLMEAGKEGLRQLGEIAGEEILQPAVIVFLLVKEQILSSLDGFCRRSSYRLTKYKSKNENQGDTGGETGSAAKEQTTEGADRSDPGGSQPGNTKQ